MASERRKFDGCLLRRLVGFGDRDFYVSGDGAALAGVRYVVVMTAATDNTRAASNPDIRVSLVAWFTVRVLVVLR